MFVNQLQGWIAVPTNLTGARSTLGLGPAMELSADHALLVGSRAPEATTAVDWEPVMEGQPLKEGADEN